MTTRWMALWLLTGAVWAQPALPPGLEVPEGHEMYLRTYAEGTQNYVCVPAGWKFLGPQATLFVTLPWMPGGAKQQAATHFLSANPEEGGTPRPTWQHSFDTSTVWAKAVAASSDPQFVAAGAIPWLRLEVTGRKAGRLGSSALAGTTFILRVNTAGGVAPAGVCDAASYGSVALVPYSTEYYFFHAARRR